MDTVHAAAPAPAAEGPAELSIINTAAANNDKPIAAPTADAMDTTEPSEPKGKEPAIEAEAGPLTVEQAQEKLAEARRHMACHDYVNAADCFSVALAAYVDRYGELAPECAELYYMYGDALLLQAGEDQTLLGGGGNAEDEKDDSDGEEGEGRADAEEGTDTGAAAGGTAAAEEEDTLASGAEGVLQLAWEVLECARLIYAKGPAKTKELAQIYMKLGEHGQITENYKQALEDFQKSLQLREAEPQPDTRSLAEIHYLMGLCCTYDKQFAEAQTEYSKAIDLIKARMEAFKDEAAELSVLLPELQEKQAEVRELMVQQERDQKEKERLQAQQMEMVRGIFEAALTAPSAGPPAQPVVRDLGSLVRKRPAPKPEAEPEAESGPKDQAEKKAKVEIEQQEGAQQ